MTRHWFASGIILGTLLAANVVGQAATPPATANEQVSQLRPGWSRSGIDPAAARDRYTIAPASTQLAQSSESRGKSFLPNWFGWRYDKSEQSSNAKANQRQSTTGNSTNQRSDSTDSSSMPPDPASIPESSSLPGLGGTPLPRSGSTANPAGVNSNSSAGSSNIAPGAASPNGRPSSSAPATSFSSFPTGSPRPAAPISGTSRTTWPAAWRARPAAGRPDRPDGAGSRFPFLPGQPA